MIPYSLRSCKLLHLAYLTRNTKTFLRNMSTDSIVAVCQMNCTENKKKNLTHAIELIHQAKSQQAQMVFLPEAFDYLGESSGTGNATDLSETLEDHTISEYIKLAKTLKIWISLGGFHEKTSEKRVKNTHLIIDDKGNIKARYSKVHLFDLDTADHAFKESEYTLPGTAIAPPVQTPIGKVGLGICYDLRFPEFSLILRHEGAEILTYPSAFTYETGAEHWATLLRARAIETQSYVIAAAQSGRHTPKRKSWGHAMIVDPWGAIIAQCTQDNCIAVAKISTKRINKIRSQMPIENHRRIDLYPKLKIEGKVKDETFQFGLSRNSYEICFYQTQLSIAFTNLKCVVPGHVLVIPKQMVEKLSDLSEEQVADLFMTVQKVEKVLNKVYSTTSSTVSLQNGEDAGQTVKHLHVHILPRHKNDFKNNDEIYKLLEEINEKYGRTFEEMREEALKLKPYFDDL